MKFLISRIGVCFSLTSLMLVAASCSDEDQTTAPISGSGVVAITVNETSTYSREEFGFIFTSALDGTVLDWVTWSEPDVLELEIPVSLGEGFYVTQVHGFSDTRKFLETSYHIVTSQNSLDLMGKFDSQLLGYTELRFQNAPPHTDYTLDTGHESTSGGRLAESYPYQLFFWKEPADILLILNGPSTPRSFIWVPEVEFQSVHDVDLASMRPMLTSSVQIPTSSFDLTCSVRGYINTSGFIPRLYYMLNYSFLSVPNPAEWHFNYLDTGFDGYYFSCSQVLAEDPRKASGTVTIGGLPNAVELPDLDVSILNPSRDGCLVQTTGEVGTLDFSWASGGVGPSSWKMVGLDPSQPAVLPQLPDDLSPLAPDLDREEFVLTSVQALHETNGVAGDGTTPMVIREAVVQYK